MMRVLTLALLMALLATPAFAQPYRWVDENGGVHYGDRPPQPAPPTLENLNPAARYRRTESSPPAPPSPAVAPTLEPPAAPVEATTSAPSEAPHPTRTESTPSRSAFAESEARRGAREIMELAGIDRYVEELAQGCHGDLARLAWSTRDPDAAWASLIAIFRRDVIAAATVTALARRLDSEHLPAAMRWLRSSEHLQLRQAQIEAAKPINQHLYRRFVAGLVDKDAKLPHLPLVQQLERTGRGAERHLALERALRQAMRRAVVPLGGYSVPDDEDDTHARSEERTRFWLVTLTLFAYRNLGSAQIEAALRFERSPAGAWFTTIAWESLDEAVRTVEQRAAAAIRSVASGGGRGGRWSREAR